MEKKFEGVVLNGFLMLFTSLALLLASIVVAISGIVMLSNETGETGGTALLVGGLIGAVVAVVMFCGFLMLEPNEARVITWFGKYAGTFTNTGYFWINPFYSVKKLSLRARNLDAKPIKVNDKVGNPVMIGLVLVWRLKDTYKAIFEIDSQTMAPANQQELGGATLKAIPTDKNGDLILSFVKVQSDAALRQVAGQYAYDDTDEKDSHELTLRDGGDEINQQLERRLAERLALAGIEVVEARINYLAYAPEIAAVMLRRQQATAIITAREKIVEGAVSMVKMALDKLSGENIVNLDDEKKAAMVSNLLVVLCGDDSAQPVVNTGSV